MATKPLRKQHWMPDFQAFTLIPALHLLKLPNIFKWLLLRASVTYTTVGVANEKTAMEAALGMSFVGKRALVCMKHVGMNVAADCFINSAITGVKGGLIVVAADDPSMHSSQNEQDSRFMAISL